MAQPAETFGNYDLVKRVKLDYTDVTVSKWQSRVTGLTVFHLDYEAPIVNGYFAVGTEIFDDSGCPHTLEHLVFMGSEKYPYKGILDLLANRGFSNGTNAWTDTDHTAYTVSTAGGQGFLQILPIYVDHILYPTITDAGFVTEVHHIDEKGCDSGVVYSEMQGRENTPGDLMALRQQRLLDPPGSAYRSETGGLMEALRVLTPDQIRKYHASYYVPHNLSLIVGGKLSGGTASLLQVIQDQIEPRLIAHGQNKGPKPPGWKRPFLETPTANRKPISENKKDTVEFPEKDESQGELIISFLGPPPNDFLTRKALDMIATYLTSSSAAPLNKEYVETEAPLCSYIYFAEDVRATYVNLPIYIASVPTEHLDTFSDKLKGSLQRIVKEKIDMGRMKMVLDRDERQLRSKLESAKGDTFSSTMISDFLYGKQDGSELYAALDEMKYFKDLHNWSGDQWAALLLKYYIDPPSVVVIGKPSAKLAEKLEKDEKARTAEQVKKLGPEGLAKATTILEEAKAEHSRPIPKEILTSFPVPDVKSISWIPVQSVQEAGKGRKGVKPDQKSLPLREYVEKDGQPLPFFVQYDHVESDFVVVSAYLSLDKIPDHLHGYGSAYLSSFFSLPVKRGNGVSLSHEEVVNQLDNDTVSYEVALGVSSSFTDTLRIAIKVEKEQYETAIAWLKDLIYNSQFDKERIQVVLAKIQQALPEMKRDGNNVLSSLWGELVYSTKSTQRAGGVMQQSEFIPKVIGKLQESPDEVIAEFERIRKYLIDPSGVRFSVTGNILGVKNPRSTWDKYFGTSLPESSLSPVRLAVDTLSDDGKKCSKKAVVMSLPTIESSFVTYTSRGIQGFGHKDYPVVRVALEVLNATESYLWRYIRGSGLAYGAYVSMDLEAGFMTFSLYRSSNPMKAYDEASTVIKGLVDGSIEFDETILDAAKSTIVYGVTKGLSTSGRAAMASFMNQALKDVPKTYQTDLLEKYQQVSKADVLSAFKTHFLPLFDPKASTAVVVTGPGNAQEVGEGLKSKGYTVEQREMHLDPNELEDDSENGSESGSEVSNDSR